MHIQVPHKSSKITALTKVKKALNDPNTRAQAREHQVEISEERWEGDTLHFSVLLQGKEVTGTLQVDDRDFIVDAKLPLLWRLFEGKIERMIAEQVKQLG